MGYGKTTAVNWYLAERAKAEDAAVVSISVYSDHLSIFWNSVQDAFEHAGIPLLRGYAVGDVYWEVTKTRDETHDGMREIEFDAYCYIPAESVPAFTTEFISVTNSELYDYYTGMWLTASSAYNNTERGDNHYIHTVTWNGETYEIEFFYSTSWEKTGDWSNVLTKSYVVYLPEGYDGLVFAAEPQPDNYRDTAKRDQLDSICPEADILNCTTVDAHNCLFFRIG